MPKDTRLYARFDIGMDENAKIARLSDAAFRALIEATFYSRRQLTDGFLDGFIAEKRWGHVLAELTSNHPERPSLVAVEGGYQIRDYGDHQTTSADIQRKREAGSAGGRAKASKTVAPATEVLEQKASTSSSTWLAKTETETETTTKTLVRSRERESFEEWWSEYPRKEGKAAAQKAYGRALKVTTADELLNGLRRYKLAKIGTEKAFIKMPAGWLNEGRWSDDVVLTSVRDAPRSAAQYLAPSVAQPPRLDPTVYCRTHDGYPVPCAACEREGGNGSF